MSLRPLVVGNWKMNGSLSSAPLLAASIASRLTVGRNRVEVAVCPPYPLLGAVGAALAASPVALGAQDVSQHADGAFTGEVSAAMLLEFGCRWVIVGHSERRHGFGETSEEVAAKALAASRAGLCPIVCVGETLADRERGATETVIAGQLAPLFELLARPEPETVLAYEPVWAIGTGRSATPGQAAEVHGFIRERLSAAGLAGGGRRILYGGSVKPASAAALFAVPGIDGGLIGGASLEADDFIAICLAADAAGRSHGVH